MPEMTASL